MLPVVRVSVVHSWCVRPSALQRPGSLECSDNELVRITTAGTVSSETMCDLLRRIATLGLRGPVTLVLDNARYQHCAMVSSCP